MFNHRRKQEKKHRMGEIPTGSFSDIAFLLIVYFLVATTLVKVKSVAVDLPSGEKQAEAQLDKTPIINLRGSEIFFSDRKVSVDELNDRLAALDLHDKPDAKKVVMLESTGEPIWETYYQALAAVSFHGGVVALVEGEESE